MTRPLRVLILEAYPPHAARMLRQLRLAGFEVTSHPVKTEADYLAALPRAPDVIRCGDCHSSFHATRALERMQQRGLDIPFLIVSGTISEERARAALRQGASVYLLEDRLTRLGPAVEQALEQHRLRRQAQAAQRDLEESQARRAGLLHPARDVILTGDAKPSAQFLNPAVDQVCRCSAAEMRGPAITLFSPEGGLEGPGCLPAPPSPSGVQPPLPPGPATVLVVEDDDSTRGLVRTILEIAGYAVLEARDGDEADRVSRQCSGTIHLLLTDVVLPGRNGRQVAERLQAEHPGLRVLFMSGYTEDVISRQGIVVAESAFLPKPFGLETLIRKVREVLAT